MRIVTRIQASVAVFTLLGGIWLSAQVPTQQPLISSQLRHATGQPVTPIYEGWFEAADGTVVVSYGYVNLNLAESLDIPIGADNVIAPGPTDRGQPTHFLPGHQKGVFTIALPEDQADQELTWSLTIRGQTMSVPTNLGPLYQIEGLVTNGGPWPGNTPPVLRFEAKGQQGQGPAGLVRPMPLTVQANADAPIDVWLSDDGLPGELTPLVVRSPQSGHRRQQGGRQMAVTWTKFRGPGEVRFEDSSPPVDEGHASTTVTFSEPGDYMLRVLVTDGSGLNGCCWTNGYVRATVH